MPPDNSRRGSRRRKNKSQGKTKEVTVDKSGREKTGNGFQKVDTMERLPSNAPTMAIAPSDYEHIFHEAAVPVERINNNEIPAVTIQPPLTQSPSPPPPPAIDYQRQRTPPPELESSRANSRNIDLQVTPDGYTLLGQVPDGRRQALPPYVVRANNQFSRAVLAKVAKYLYSRSDAFR